MLTLPALISDEWKKAKYLFSDFFVVPQKIYEGLKGLHKTFWGTTKKCENKNLT